MGGRAPARRGSFGAAVVLSALVYAPPTAFADWSAPLKRAQELLSQGSFTEAYGEYLDQAEREKNPVAQFTVALFYDLGWGRPRDPSIACRWYERAAEARLPAAQHALADCLVGGSIGAPDPARAAPLYRDAGDAGHWISLCSLGELYRTGAGVPKDPATGAALCEQAAARGIVKAMRLTGLAYLDGDPMVRDPARGRRWLEQAAGSGDPQAQHRLGLLLRDAAADPAAQETARNWLETAAAQGWGPAYFPVAEMYFVAWRDASESGPRADLLAKAYLWLSAAIRPAFDPSEVARAQEMLATVVAEMPESWRPDLDAKLSRHFSGLAAP